MTSARSPQTATPAHTAVGRTGVPGLSWWRAIGIGAIVATVANLLVLAVASAAGASLTYIDAGATGQVDATSVILSSAVPLIVGVALAAVIARWWRGVIRLAQVLGAGLALGTIPPLLSMDTDGGTQAALAVMHLIMAPIVVAVLEAGRRHRG